MKLQPGWLLRQCEAARKEIETWSQLKKEVMFCFNGHTWLDPKPISSTQEAQTCKYCGRQRIKSEWAEDWVIVKRGHEARWCK